MTDMTELKKRKEPLNLAIVHVDPDLFLEHYLDWLEITNFISALRAGTVQVPPDGKTPPLTAQDFAGPVVQKVANDAVTAFCMTAALKGDKAAVDKIEAELTARLGPDFPGLYGLKPFRDEIGNPETLEDHVGQAGRKLLTGDIPPPPLRSKENWNTGIRFFEKARNSNFVHEIMYPLAKWVRAAWTETLEKGIAFLAHIEDNVPVLREVLEETRNDQPFIANTLLKVAPAVDMELTDEYQGFLRSLARR